MKKNIPDRPPKKVRSDAVFAEAAKKAEKLSKKVLTSGNRIDIINKQSAMTHKNKSEMLLWLSRQSTSLVRHEVTSSNLVSSSKIRRLRHS